MPRGGPQPGAGRPKGSKNRSTLSKEAGREVLRAIVLERMTEMVDAQLNSAIGLAHFMLRDPDSGQFRRVTDPAEIEAALNAPGAAEGSTFWIYTKDPSTAAFADLMNRTLDRPKEQPQEILVTHQADALLERLDAWKLANRRAAALEAAMDVAPVSASLPLNGSEPEGEPR